MKKNLKLSIKEVELSSLNPAPYNPRDISETAFEGLKESIKKFGFVEPLIINTRTGLLVGGHQRLKAATALELPTVPVVEVDLSPAEEKALNISLNNQRISGHYTDALQSLLAEIKDEFADSFEPLKLNELVIDSAWESGLDKVDKTDENLDGITAKIIVKCPQVMREEVKMYLQARLLETGFEGVEIA